MHLGVQTLMGIQLVIDTAKTPGWEQALGAIAFHCEVFSVGAERLGVSIPTNVVDDFGKSEVTKMLEALRYFDLWAGMWNEPKSKWKFWH
jgi:hypothetical protein